MAVGVKWRRLLINGENRRKAGISEDLARGGNINTACEAVVMAWGAGMWRMKMAAGIGVAYNQYQLAKAYL